MRHVVVNSVHGSVEHVVLRNIAFGALIEPLLLQVKTKIVLGGNAVESNLLQERELGSVAHLVRFVYEYEMESPS